MSLTPVTISYQPAMYWAMPIYLADKLGCFKELGLDASFVAHPSGGPQVRAAVESKAWDVGGAGVVPNILGWSKSPGLETIGVSNDESATNALVANGHGIADWPNAVASGTLGRGVQMIITPNSTGHFAVLECLKHFNVSYDADENFLCTPGQDAVKAGMSDLRVANCGSLWAPNTFNFVEKNKGSQVICNGTTAGAPVPGGIMVRKEFGDERPDLVAKILAAWLRGVNYMLDPDYRDDTINRLRKFYAFPISDSAIEIEFTRPLCGLEGQLEMMNREGNGASELGMWFQRSIDFMMSQGTLSKAPVPDEYINVLYAKMICEDDFSREYTVRPGPRAINYNYLTSIRPVGLTFVALAMMGSIICTIWTWIKRKHRIVKASQPFFLVMISCGTFILASSIIPLSIDDSIATQWGCSVACMAFPWLLSIGFTTIFAALFAKIWRLNQLVHHASHFRRVTIHVKDVLLPFAILMTINVALLLLWSFIDPLIWVRTKASDNTDYESFGCCYASSLVQDGTSADSGFSYSILWGGLIVLLNFCALAMANYQAWKARNTSTAYSESSYIGYTMVSLLQAILIGLPVLLLVLQSNAIVYYFVWSVLIFIVCTTILLLMFVPKMLMVSKRETKSPGRPLAMSGLYSSTLPTSREAVNDYSEQLTIREDTSTRQRCKDGVNKLKILLEAKKGINDADMILQKAGLLFLVDTDKNSRLLSGEMKSQVETQPPLEQKEQNQTTKVSFAQEEHSSTDFVQNESKEYNILTINEDQGEGAESETSTLTSKTKIRSLVVGNMSV